MAVEAKRGCGFRRVGGTYLETDPGGFECGRLPIPLIPCPLCDQRPRFTRGLQRITPKMVLHAAPDCGMGGERCAQCPFGSLLSADIAGLMWVGGKFYTPREFEAEAARLGVSKRVPWPTPKWLEIGKTWVLLAHEETITETCPTCQGSGMHETPDGKFYNGEGKRLGDCEDCGRTGKVRTPGVFHAFVPRRIVRIVPDDMPEQEREALREQGLTLVEVPADDPDHQPSKRRGEDE